MGKIERFLTALAQKDVLCLVLGHKAPKHTDYGKLAQLGMNDLVIDEIPAAYKDIDKVMENQSDLVEIVHTLHQVMCVKG